MEPSIKLWTYSTPAGMPDQKGQTDLQLVLKSQQLEALRALWKAVHESADIPYETPLNQFGNTSNYYEQQVAYGKFRGFVSHYHVSKRKIDCAGLDIKTLLDEVKEEE